ncbi:MAG: toll/interleukin-1 receptor domain-containing protein [Chloroflexota bacterium]|nr:toll/interleukin-1 receptor domain-containing protein [Chloroflexota bacterium]
MTDDIKRNRRESDEKIARGEYDVFLSYNHKDRERVIEIGNWLKDNGIAPWLDEWDLQPGKSWIRAIMQQISKSKAAAIFISEAGPGLSRQKRWRHSCSNMLLAVALLSLCCYQMHPKKRNCGHS